MRARTIQSESSRDLALEALRTDRILISLFSYECVVFGLLRPYRGRVFAVQTCSCKIFVCIGTRREEECIIFLAAERRSFYFVLFRSARSVLRRESEKDFFIGRTKAAIFHPRKIGLFWFGSFWGSAACDLCSNSVAVTASSVWKPKCERRYFGIEFNFLLR